MTSGEPAAVPSAHPVELPRALRPPAEAGPLPYHRLLRGLAGFRWWRALLAVGLAAVIYFALAMLWFVIIFTVGIVTGVIDLGTTLADANAALMQLAAIDAASPLSLLLALGIVILMLPSALLGQLAAGLRPLGVRHSVAFRIRWRWFAVSMVPALVMVAVSLAIPIGLSLIAGVEPLGPITTEPGLLLVCVVMIVLLTPFQAAAEEYMFRGLLAQAVGSWVRYAPIGWIITTALFIAGHVYDVWGLISVGAFGFAAAIVVSRTGGLEAGIAMHTVNNIAGFLLLASGVQGSTVNPSASSSDLAGNLVNVGVIVLTSAAWVLWITVLARRRGLVTQGGMLAPVAHDSVAAPAAPATPR